MQIMAPGAPCLRGALMLWASLWRETKAQGVGAKGKVGERASGNPKPLLEHWSKLHIGMSSENDR